MKKEFRVISLSFETLVFGKYCKHVVVGEEFFDHVKKQMDFVQGQNFLSVGVGVSQYIEYIPGRPIYMAELKSWEWNLDQNPLSMEKPRFIAFPVLSDSTSAIVTSIRSVAEELGMEVVHMDYAMQQQEIDLNIGSIRTRVYSPLITLRMKASCYQAEYVVDKTIPLLYPLDFV